MSSLLHYLGFNLVWCACVLGAAQGWPTLGPAAGLLLVAVSVATSPRRGAELRGVLTVAGLGLALDSLLLLTGVLRFSSPSPWPDSLAPLWIVALWAAFATLLTRSLGALRGRWLLAAALGAVAGPLTYLGAAALGAAELRLGPGAVGIAVGLEYAVALPLSVWAMAPAQAEPASQPAPAPLEAIGRASP